MGIYQKIKDWYTGPNELESPARREALGKLVTGLEMLVIGGSILGLASKVSAGERRYINEYYDKGKPIPEIEGAREKTLSGGFHSNDLVISFQDNNKFLSFYLNSNESGNKLRDIIESQIDVNYIQFDEFINTNKDSEKLNVGFFKENYMIMGIKKKGKFKGIIIPFKKGSYEKLLDFEKKYFR